MHELSLFFSDAHDTERPKVEAAFHLLRAQMWAAAAAATELEDELCRVTPCHNDAHWKNHNNVIPDLTQLRLHENHTDAHTRGTARCRRRRLKHPREGFQLNIQQNTNRKELSLRRRQRRRRRRPPHLLLQQPGLVLPNRRQQHRRRRQQQQQPRRRRQRRRGPPHSSWSPLLSRPATAKRRRRRRRG